MTYSLVPYQEYKNYRGHDKEKDRYLIEGMLEQASEDIQDSCHRSFVPELKTLYFDHPPDPSLIKFNDDLLQLVSLKTDNGSTTITPSTNYFLMWADQYEGPPYDRVVLNPYGTQPLFSYTDSPLKANEVNGYWGYHEKWAKAWVSTGDTVRDAPLSSSATSLTVLEADGTWPNGKPNRFSSLQILKIESEYLYVELVNTASDTLIVERGVLGTTAAEHAQGTVIYSYQVDRPIMRLTLRLADWYYGQKDTKEDTADRPIVTASGVTIMPRDMPRDVTKGIQRYKRTPMDSGLKTTSPIRTRYPF